MTEMVMVLETIRTDRALIDVLQLRVTVSMATMAVVILMEMDLPIPSTIVPTVVNLGVTSLDAPIRMVTVGQTPQGSQVGTETAIQPIGCKRLIPMVMVDTTTTVQIAVARMQNPTNSH